MRRILVPLDGSKLAEVILPDARRLAGPNGELIIFRDVNEILYDRFTGTYTSDTVLQEAESYLHSIGDALRHDGVRVETRLGAPYDVPWAIDMAAKTFQVDMIACATHGRGPLGRLIAGSTAWKALATSPVPVLLRHIEETHEQAWLPPESKERRILVPLDGSAFAEAAVPLAATLAAEWGAPIWFVEVIPDVAIPYDSYRYSGMSSAEPIPNVASAQAYLEEIGYRLPVKSSAEVMVGQSVAAGLAKAVGYWSITDIVMTSHGRTGLSRAIMGSVADQLIHELHCPIVVIPAPAVQTEEAVHAEHKVNVPAL